MAPRASQCRHQLGLEQVLVGVVMLLAEQDEVRLRQLLAQRGLIHPACVGDIPDAADERVVSEQLAPPLAGRAGLLGSRLSCARRGASSEEQDRDESEERSGTHERGI